MWCKVAFVFLLAVVCSGQPTSDNKIEVENINTDRGIKIKSIAANKKYVVIGYPDPFSLGSVGVYENKPGYKLIKRLAPNDLTKGCEFGNSVAANDDYIVVGAKFGKGKYKSQGAVYVYKIKNDENDWEYQKIEERFPGDFHYFGFSVAINTNNELVVGSIGSSKRVNRFEIDYRAGAAHLFTVNNNSGKWILKQTLIPKGLESKDYMGFSVAITNEYVAVSAEPTFEFEGPGTVYIFKRTTLGKWVEDVKLGSPNPRIGGGFGSDIAMYGNRIIIGADEENSGSGNAYIFVKSKGRWTLEGQLERSGWFYISDYTNFGTSVAIFGNQAVVGTSLYQPGSLNIHGQVFKLVNGRWVKGKELHVRKEGHIRSLALLDGKIYAGTDARDSPASFVFSNAL